VAWVCATALGLWACGASEESASTPDATAPAPSGGEAAGGQGAGGQPASGGESGGSDRPSPTDAAPSADAAPPADAALQDARVVDAEPEPADAAPCESDEAFFVRAISPRISAEDPAAPACRLCHVPEGPAFGTRLVFDAPANDLAAFEAFVQRVPEAAALLLDKPTARVPHGGGQRFAPGSADERAFRTLVERLVDPADSACPAPEPDAEADAAPVADAEPPPPDLDAAVEPSPDAAGPPPGCISDDDYLRAAFVPLVDTADPARPACMLCHVSGGLAGNSRMVFSPYLDDAAFDANVDMLRRFFVDTPDGARLFLEKPTGLVPHGGARRFAPQSEAAAVFREVVARVSSAADACDVQVDPPDVGPPPIDRCRLDGPHAGAAPLRRLTDVQFANTISRVLGVQVPPASRPSSVSSDGFHTFAVNNIVSAPTVESLQFTAEEVAAEVDLGQRLLCAPNEREATCVARFLVSAAESLFRRPPTAAELETIALLGETGLPLNDAARFGLEVLLQSPQFLYLDPDAEDLAPGEARAVSPATLAARIAYFLTNAPPPRDLRAQALAGQLQTRDEAHAAALSLLGSPDVIEVIARFHRDWLHLDGLDRIAKDPERYPDWNAELVEALRTEVDLFTTEVVWSGDARFETLMTDTRSWVTPELAALYGVAAPGPGFRRVDLGPERPGVLTRSAFLAAHAYSATSSPVRRGAFVLEQLLCESLSPPPGVNMDLPEGPAAAESVRERLVQHWTDPTCATCHNRIDPIGLSFEHFGAAGEWREVYENGQAVEAAGALADPEVEFDDALTLLPALATSPRVQGCYVQRWYEYAVGRAALPEDRCTIELLTRRFEESGGDLRALLADVASTDAFLYATTSSEEVDR
jgi:hypothetical protein